MVGEGFDLHGNPEQLPEIYIVCVARAPSMEGAHKLTLAMMAELFGGSVVAPSWEPDEVLDHAPLG